MLLTRLHLVSQRYTCSLISPFSSSPLLTFLLPFSTYETPNNFKNDPPLLNHLCNQDVHVDESPILSQLSDILPIPRSSLKIYDKPLITDSFTIRTAAVDGFLSPEEKFRGIFLQKLRGRSAVEESLTNVGIDITIDILEKVVSRGNLSGDSMVMFFNWAVLQSGFPKDVCSYNLIFKALGRRKYFKHIMEMLADMTDKGIYPNCDTLSVVVDCFIRARQVSKGIKMWEDFKDFGLKCNTETFNVLMKCLTRRSHVRTACSLMNKVRGKVPFDRMTYNLVIGGWSRLGKITDVEKNLKAMVEDGIDADNSTYSYIIEGFGRAGQVDSAAKVFRELEEEYVLGVEVYNAMIANYVHSGEMDEGLRYFEKLLDNNCEPNMVTFVILISGCLKARRVADAIEMFDQMLYRGIVPSAGTITSFIEPLCCYGPPHAALMIYEKAKKAGCKMSLNCYKLLIMQLSKFGKCQTLLNIWHDMQENGYCSDVQVYEYAINGFCNIGQLENAVLAMEECLSKGFCPNRILCSKLNNKLMNSRKVEVAYRLFLKIKEARGNEKAKRSWRMKGWHF
ncbi:OLC1v1025400C1 [Oldenlandia corymbosa var. corymbosa]|uniref:OLC1v1025400C1 n=1 Tax=Oldenlandia corymbosa var. corymbosa TaxID=529605 RepID=A0AAV1C7H7_OLDCO|nr:OLC1v1025400C1 [Oldenlandia corymbosa var. corymbosa]